MHVGGRIILDTNPLKTQCRDLVWKKSLVSYLDTLALAKLFIQYLRGDSFTAILRVFMAIEKQKKGTEMMKAIQLSETKILGNHSPLSKLWQQSQLITQLRQSKDKINTKTS